MTAPASVQRGFNRDYTPGYTGHVPNKN